MPNKALPLSPGPGWGHARCHWGSCTLTQVCCYYWGRNLKAEDKGKHGYGSQLRPFWVHLCFLPGGTGRCRTTPGPRRL